MGMDTATFVDDNPALWQHERKEDAKRLVGG